MFYSRALFLVLFTSLAQAAPTVECVLTDLATGLPSSLQSTPLIVSMNQSSDVTLDHQIDDFYQRESILRLSSYAKPYDHNGSITVHTEYSVALGGVGGGNNVEDHFDLSPEQMVAAQTTPIHFKLTKAIYSVKDQFKKQDNEKATLTPLIDPTLTELVCSAAKSTQPISATKPALVNQLSWTSAISFRWGANGQDYNFDRKTNQATGTLTSWNPGLEVEMDNLDRVTTLQGLSADGFSEKNQINFYGKGNDSNLADSLSVFFDWKKNTAAIDFKFNQDWVARNELKQNTFRCELKFADGVLEEIKKGVHGHKAVNINYSLSDDCSNFFKEIAKNQVVGSASNFTITQDGQPKLVTDQVTVEWLKNVQRPFLLSTGFMYFNSEYSNPPGQSAVYISPPTFIFNVKVSLKAASN